METMELINASENNQNSDVVLRTERLHESTNLVDALSAYLGGEITPLCAKRELSGEDNGVELEDSDFNNSLLFLLDNKYLLRWVVDTDTTIGDSWCIDIPTMSSDENGKIELSLKATDNVQIDYGPFNPGNITDQKQQALSHEDISNRIAIANARQTKLIANLAVERFMQVTRNSAWSVLDK